MSINEFLEIARSKLDETSGNAQLVLVIGNDSADLDSIISAVLMAYLSQKKTTTSNTFYIPLVKVPFADLTLRPEVGYVFDKAGIDITKLICIDQVDTSIWKNNIDNNMNTTTPNIILVDHNRLTSPLDHLEQHCQIVGIVDHHVDEGAYLDSPLRWIEMVGSCTSQVILLLSTEIDSLSDVEKKAVATLAAAPILVDTIGFCWDMGKTTQKDVEAFSIVCPLAFDTTPLMMKMTEGQKRSNNNMTPQATIYYDTIENIKSQVDHLCTRDLLRKDYKQWTVNGYTVGTSSMSWYLKAWVDRDGYDKITKDAWAFINEQKLDMLLVLTSYDHSKQESHGVYERELAFFVANEKLLKIKDEMERKQDVGMTSLLPVWGKQDLDDLGGRIGFYNQKNIKLSRKQIWPLIQDLLLKLY